MYKEVPMHKDLKVLQKIGWDTIAIILLCIGGLLVALPAILKACSA